MKKYFKEVEISEGIFRQLLNCMQGRVISPKYGLDLKIKNGDDLPVVMVATITTGNGLTEDEEIWHLVVPENSNPQLIKSAQKRRFYYEAGKGVFTEYL